MKHILKEKEPLFLKLEKNYFEYIQKPFEEKQKQ
jgi:hypothetical protein